jgi:hypothetical protein
MKNNMEKIKKTQEELKQMVEQMPLAERGAAASVVYLGEMVAAMLSQRNWHAIAEMQKVCDGIFEEARKCQMHEKFFTVQ